MESVTETLNGIAEAVNSDQALLRRGRYVDLEFLLAIGDAGYFVAVCKGRVDSVTPGPALLRPWRFAIHIESDAWRQFRQPMPRPGYHDLFAMCKLGVARIEGDIHPLMANLRYFKELLAKRCQSEISEAIHGR
ncbi:MAG: hypothetical protein HN478_19450 [Rhodospirillaceae bacterium]|jgi:hypothetical protein|nr:hypothetical protein [Rhodospirillaceae bacterium]MBT4489857.1 hypothetical protein [Rhodospirillaceae bacterium]MBT5894924.1 hypothetical protein [Rhodospirillaceae bacterium]MBT6427296.1 hypothetical protein [Rhodospirillaceae bacterium]MBT7756803.1 hypothetical protein [Rhodospirillaceae bacterium]